MNPGSAGILPALLSRMSHALEFIISWTSTNMRTGRKANGEAMVCNGIGDQRRRLR